MDEIFILGFIIISMIGIFGKKLTRRYDEDEE
jgi:hypothetical protein